MESERYDNSEVTEMVVEALFCVYDSEAQMDASDIANAVSKKTGSWSDNTQKIVDRLFTNDPPLLMDSRDERYKTMFAATGLWLLEDCFMHGEENIDGMAIAERNLAKAHFFDED